MCNPGFIAGAKAFGSWAAANAGTIATVASTAVSGYSAYQQGKQAEDVADFNARQMENESTRARNKAAEEENEHRRKVSQLVSKQRAQFGAMGVDVNSGSAFRLQRDAEILGEADALRIRKNYDQQATALTDQASLTRQQGDNAARSGKMKLAGSLIGSAGKVMGSGVADKWFGSNSAAKVGRAKTFNTSVNLPQSTGVGV